MLSLSEALGQDVFSADGRRLGRAVELTVRVGDDHPAVVGLGVGRGRRVRQWVAWGQVASFERSRVELTPAARLVDVDEHAGRAGPGPGPGEIRLMRDVLDCQIVDVTGARLVRVGDVLLSRFGLELRVIAVEVGGGAVWRRLGLRALGRRFATRAIDWKDLRLTSGPGLAVQRAVDSASGRHLGGAELTAIVANVTTEQAIEILRTVSPEDAAAALASAHPEVGARLVASLPQPEAVSVVARMPADDAVAALRELAPDHLARLLEGLGTTRAGVLLRLLAAPPDTAGGLMTTEFRTALPDESIEEIRARFAADPPGPEGLATVFVVDDEGAPLGVYEATDLLAGRGPQVAPVLHVDDAVERVIDVFGLHDFLALPVVDASGRVVGAVAVDDVLEELLLQRLPGGREPAVLSAHGRRAPRRSLRWPRRRRGAPT